MASGIDIIARGLGARGLAEGLRANHRLDLLPNGLVYIGAVDYYDDLPSEATVGSVYTVKYKGSSGYVADGSEYVYGEYGGENQWIRLGPELPNMDSLMAYTEVHEINVEVQNGTASGAEFVETGSFPTTVTITADEGYVLPDEITVNEQTGSSGSTDAVWSYDSETGEISLSNATDTVDIVAVCEAEQPEPSALVPFEIGQTIYKAKFDTTKSIQEITNLLSTLPYNQDDAYEFVGSTSDGGVISAGNLNGVYAIAVDAEVEQSIRIVFASDVFEPMGIMTAGWQNTLDSNGEITLETGGTVNKVSDVAGWNGIIVGAIEALL